jgi:hypothetical protein
MIRAGLDIYENEPAVGSVPFADRSFPPPRPAMRLARKHSMCCGRLSSWGCAPLRQLARTREKAQNPIEAALLAVCA